MKLHIYIKILKYLESRGCNIYFKNKNNINAYLIALKRNNLKIIKYLESRGFKPKLNYVFNNCNIKIVNYIKRQIKLRLNRMRMNFIFGQGQSKN